MFVNKRIIVLCLLIFPVFSMFAQATVNINDYGVYFIDEGVVKNIPMPQKYYSFMFWRNYIIFSFYNELSEEGFIYNTENDARSDYFRIGDDFFPIDSNNNNLLFHASRADYEINPVSLRTVAVRTAPRRGYWEEKLADYGDNPNIIVEDINEWEHRYYGENFYLTVILSRNIPYYTDRFIGGGRKNQFVFIVRDTYTVK